MMHIVPIKAIVELVHLVQVNAASDGINNIWLVNYHVYKDTYWMVY